MPGDRPSFAQACLRRTRAAASVLLVALLALHAAGALAFDLQGHRGTRGLEPENTLAAFRAALAIGVDTLELDVHATRDGELVIAHDPRLNAAFTRDAAGQWIDASAPAIIELTLAQLQRYDIGRARPGSKYARTWPEQRRRDGEHVPTLASLFEMLHKLGARDVRLNIEVKLSPLTPELTPPPEHYVRSLLAVIDAHDMAARVSIQSFDWRTLSLVHRLAPGIATAALTARQRGLDNLGDPRWSDGLVLAEHGDSVPRMVKAAGAATWSPHFGELSEAQVGEAHALGLKVVPWTVDDPADVQRLVAWKVDGLITDYPDRARAVLVRLGIPVAAPLP